MHNILEGKTAGCRHHRCRFQVFRQTLLVTLTALILGMTSTRPDAAASETAGFTIPSQAIGQTLRTALPLYPPGTIAGGWRTDAGITWTNVWAQEDTYLMDYETAVVHAGISRGITPFLGMAVVYDNRRFFSGGMDGLIQEGHDLLGINQNHRDAYPRNRATIELFDKITGDTIEVFSPDRLDNSGISLIVNTNLGNAGGLFSSVNLYGVARLPLETPKILDQPGGLETGLGLGVSRRWGDQFSTTAVLGYTAYRDARYTGTVCDVLSFENHQITAMAAAAWQVRPRLSLQGQYIYTTPVIKGLKGMDKAAHEVLLGAKCRLGRRHTLTVAFIENIITMDNSPDFGLHVSVQQQL